MPGSPAARHRSDAVTAHVQSAFVSYARNDVLGKDRVVGILGQCGVQARGDWELKPGPEFMPLLKGMIREVDAFVFVLSPNSLRRDADRPSFCLIELEVAIALGKRILPVVVANGFDDRDMAVELRTPQWAFLRDGDDAGSAGAFLADAIQTDYDLVATHTWLTQRAADWDAKGKSRSAFLRGRELREAADWLPRIVRNPMRLPNVTPLQQEYITASQRAQTRRLRIGIVLSGLIACVLVGLLIMAWVAWQDEKRARQNEEVARGATRARDLAELALRPGHQRERLREVLQLAREAQSRGLAPPPELTLALCRAVAAAEVTVPLPDDDLRLARMPTTRPAGNTVGPQDSNPFVASTRLSWDGERQLKISGFDQQGNDILRIMDVGCNRCIFSSENMRLGRLKGAALAPSGDRFMPITYNGTQSVYDVYGSPVGHAIPVGYDRVDSAYLSPHGGCAVLSLVGHHGWMVASTQTGKTLLKAPVDHSPETVSPRPIEFSADDSRFVLVRGKEVEVRDARDGSLVAAWSHGSDVFDVKISVDGNQVTVKLSDDSHLNWAIAPDVSIARFRSESATEDAPRLLRFSSDGRTLYSSQRPTWMPSSVPSLWHSWDVVTHAPTGETTRPTLQPAPTTKAGRNNNAGGSDPSLPPGIELIGQPEDLADMARSPDGSLVATIDRIGVIRVFPGSHEQLVRRATQLDHYP